MPSPPQEDAVPAPSPGAGNDDVFTAAFKALLQLMRRRASAANAFNRMAALCTASTPKEPFKTPLDLTSIRECIQEQVTSVFGAPRGILVVR